MTNNKSRWIVGVAGIAMVLQTLGAQAQVPAQPVAMPEESGTPISHFEIARFEVQGNTLLPGTMIDQLLAPYAGKDRDFGSVQRALEALEGAYHQRGYNLVQVELPEQELNQGVVRLKVVETRIGKISVVGNKFFDQANILRSVPALREGESPDVTKVSASLKIANENPDKKTNLRLQSGDQDDEVNATLSVEDEKVWSAGLSLDNSGDSNTGRSHLSVLGQDANFAGHDHVLSLQYTTSLENPSQVSVYGVGYHIPLYSLGDTLDFYGSYSNVDSGSVAVGLVGAAGSTDLLVSGQGAVYGTRFTHYLGHVDNFESKLMAGLDYKAFKNSVLLDSAQLGNNVTVHPLSLGYVTSWTLPTGEIDITLTAEQNIPGGENGEAADFNRVRAGASSSYNLLRYGAIYSRVLPLDWQLHLMLNGQYTRDMLVPGEQFGAGGASSVRGFTERAISNDSGQVANAEIYTPNLCAGPKFTATQCRMLGFIDGGHVQRNNPLPEEQAQASISSFGFGIRLNMSRYLAMQMDVGQVVDGSDVATKGQRRMHFKMGLIY